MSIFKLRQEARGDGHETRGKRPEAGDQRREARGDREMRCWGQSLDERRSPAPGIGNHSIETLKSLSYTPEEPRSLRKNKTT
jgi:hypothetical protein